MYEVQTSPHANALRPNIALVAASLLVAFVGLGMVAHAAAHGTGWDHAVLGWMIEHRRGWLTTVAVAITTAGSPVVMGLLAVSVAATSWWQSRSLTPGLVVVGTLALASGVSTLTKVVVGAHRPPQSVQLVAEVDPSFPSGHVTGTLALLGVIAVLVGRGRRRVARVALGAAVVVATAAVALTRLYLGVHWLTDIGGGVLLGGLAALLGSAVLATPVVPRSRVA
jgi:membrane-associated phospholipid phosphatase